MYLNDLKLTYSKYFTENTEDVSSFLDDIDDSSLTFTIGLEKTTIDKLILFLNSSSNPNYDKGIFIHYLMEKYLLKYKLDEEFRKETHAKHFCNPPIFEIEENYDIKKHKALADDLDMSDSDSNDEVDIYTTSYNLKVYGGELIDNLDNEEIILEIFKKLQKLIPTKKEIQQSNILTVLKSTQNTFSTDNKVFELYSNLISIYNDIMDKTVPEIDKTTKAEKIIDREIVRTFSESNRCKMCKKNFSCSSSLNRHMREVHKPINKCFTCTTCDKVYKRKDVLQKHISSCHENEKFKNFHCPYCSQKYGQKFNLNKHIRRCHKCSICNIAYKNQNDLKCHEFKRHNSKNLTNHIDQLADDLEMSDSEMDS